MLPIVGYPMTFAHLLRACCRHFDAGAERALDQRLQEMVPAEHVFWTNSATAACCLIFEILKTRSRRVEIILPAYTASSLIAAIRQADLTAVLCDTEKDGFNAGADEMLSRVTDRTLGVLCVHMFGLPVNGIAGLRHRLPPDVFLIEDAAQAFGSRSGERMVAGFGDVGFFSFNRGKNLPLYGGGCIVTGRGDLAEALASKTAHLRKPGPMEEALSFIKTTALKAASCPMFYGFIFPFLAKSKEKIRGLPDKISVGSCTRWQKMAAFVLLEVFERSCEKRIQNASMLVENLKGCVDIVVPRIAEGERPALNRFPVLFREAHKRKIVRAQLLRCGIESSEFYFKPLHHIFDLGYRKNDFPNAVYLAERLLTLPVHPYVGKKEIEVMTEVVKKAVV